MNSNWLYSRDKRFGYCEGDNWLTLFHIQLGRESTISYSLVVCIADTKLVWTVSRITNLIDDRRHSVNLTIRVE